MKKQLAFLLFGLTSSLGFAQSSSVVPPTVKAAFASSHPGVTVTKWEKEGKDYEAGFTLNGMKNSELYDAKGKLLESELQIPVTELPRSVVAYMSEKFPGKEISEAAKITNANGSIIFEAEMDHKDYLFDSEGSLVNTPDEEGEGSKGSGEDGSADEKGEH
jgi:hypothetical protein